MFAGQGRQPQIDAKNVVAAGFFELILRWVALWRKFQQRPPLGQGDAAQIGGNWLNVNIRYIAS